MNKKNILLALLGMLLILGTVIAGPQTDEVYAYDQYSTEMETHVWDLPGHPVLEEAGYYWVDFISATTESALLQRGGECPTPCNTHGEFEGYTQFIGYGDGHAACWSDAADYRQDWMTEEQREILWASTGACRAPELGQTACVWFCCQPAPPVQFWGWRHWDFIEE